MIRVEYVREHKEARFPLYATALSAGADVFAAIDKPIVMMAGDIKSISTGLRIASMTAQSEIQIRSRSGLALKHGVIVLNAPGTIDADYRGIIGVILMNQGRHPFTIHPGDRIAQMVYAPVFRAQQVEGKEVQATARGDGGFGSTGGV